MGRWRTKLKVNKMLIQTSYWWKMIVNQAGFGLKMKIRHLSKHPLQMIYFSTNWPIIHISGWELTVEIYNVIIHIIIQSKHSYLLDFSLKNLKFKIYKTIILPVVLYGCEAWPLTLREECGLRVFENRILSSTFGPKGMQMEKAPQ